MALEKEEEEEEEGEEEAAPDALRRPERARERGRIYINAQMKDDETGMFFPPLPPLPLPPPPHDDETGMFLLAAFVIFVFCRRWR